MGNRLETLRDEIDRLLLNATLDNRRMYVSHIYGVANFCTLLAMKRNMNVELAATCGMLHDIYYMTGESPDNHAVKGAEQAEQLLKATGAYGDDEIKTIISAISKHSDKSAVDEPYDELLKDADVMEHCFYNADFPVAEWEESRNNNLIKEFGLTGGKQTPNKN